LLEVKKKGSKEAVAVLSALTEIISQEKSKDQPFGELKNPSPVDYFAALVSTLSQQQTRLQNDPTLAAILYLIATVGQITPQEALVARFETLGRVLITLLGDKEEKLEVSCGALSVISLLLKARIEVLRHQSTSKDEKSLANLWVTTPGGALALKMIQALLVFSVFEVASASESAISKIANKGARETLGNLSASGPLPKSVVEAVVGFCLREVEQLGPKKKNNVISLSELLQSILFFLSTTAVATILTPLVKLAKTTTTNSESSQFASLMKLHTF